MNINLLAYYMGYAFCHAVNVQHLIAPPELMVPYVVYWQSDQPTPVPYPAATQNEAVEKARTERERRSSEITGWSSGREGLLPQAHGTKIDVLVIEGWVPGLEPPIEMLTAYRRDPFRLVQGFLWKDHPQVRRSAEDRRDFMREFQRGMLSQPFGQQCLEYVSRSEPFTSP
jgi:hypothetical protein